MEAAGVHTLSATVVLLLISRALWYLVWRPYAVAWRFERQGIRGPPYKFVVGSMWDIKQMLVARRAKGPLDIGSHNYTSRVSPFFHKWTSDYGKTFLYWLGPTPAICSTDTELVKQVLDDRTNLFQKDYLNPSMETIFGKGLLTTNGDDWKRHRRIVYPIFNQEKLKSVSAMTSEDTQKMIEQWCTQIEKGNGQAETDMRCCSDDLTLGVIERVIFGENCKEAREVFIAGKEGQKLAVYAFADPPIPGFRYFPTRRNFQIWKLNKLATSKITHLIKTRLIRGVSGDDLLRLMLQAYMSKEVESLSTEEMVGECKTLFAAGQDTGASLLTWGMFLLSKYPEWQEKLREEVLRECQDDDGEAPRIEVLGKLKLLNMFLLETLRLYSPVPFVMRKTAYDTALANIRVPKGTMITIPIMMLHRCKEIWGVDVDEFNPMRFEKGISRAAKNTHALWAFSYGPRGCPGRNFAMIQVQTVIAMILRRFSFSLSSRYVHMPMYFITLVPRYGLPLIVKNLPDGEKIDM
ncbi:cytochrome P450 709B2-like [Hordeum vulgare subsp. vulgare]|uniref:cytochrome P450 709B2-like n=1 Tax=Hordeum vulgare subsp. vulgare TaxID=112509 RepID=UPI000B46C48E|nr:cytochrome P450 709B2-like [Hordeum vulgare subsp. vulgare]